MPNFRYQALNTAGETVEGHLQADTVQRAVEQLAADGLTVQSIGYAAEGAVGQAVPDSDRRWADRQAQPDLRSAAAAEQEVLRGHMAQVLERGRAIAPALAAYADEMPSGRRRRQLLKVVRILERGDVAEATAALARLPEYWIPLLSAAASSHDPGRLLAEFLKESQQAEELRRQRWMLFAYPLFVVLLAFAVVTALSLLVVPTLRDVFDDFDLQLPALTFAILGLSHWINSGRILIDGAVLLFVIGIVWAAMRWLFTPTHDWLALRFGVPWGRRTAIARFARFTADLLEAGLDVPSAIRIAGYSTKRPRLRTAAWQLAASKEQGGANGEQGLRRLVSASVLHALEADVSPEARVTLLREVSECHATRTRLRFSWVHGVIEPVTICAVGAVVAVTVLAMFLPLVKLIEGLTG